MLVTIHHSTVGTHITTRQRVAYLLVATPRTLGTHFASLANGHLVSALTAAQPKPTAADISTTAKRTLHHLTHHRRGLATRVSRVSARLRALAVRTTPAVLTAGNCNIVAATALLVDTNSGPSQLHARTSFTTLYNTTPVPTDSNGAAQRHLGQNNSQRNG